MFAPCEEIPHVSPKAGRDVGHPTLVVCTNNSGALQQLV